MKDVYRHDCEGARIYAIQDAVLAIPPGNFVGLETVRAVELLGEETDSVPVTLNCFLVEMADGQTCLIDTGIGKAVPNQQGVLANRLRALGITPQRIFLSHFHIDHIGGLSTVEGLADRDTEIFVPEAELAYWTQAGFPLGAPEGQGRSRPAVAAFLEKFAGRLRTVGPDFEPLPGLRQIPLPGHTPGHTGFRIGDVVIWGDIVHSADLQCAEPDCGYVADVDPLAAAALRKKVFAETAREGTLIAGMHLPAPGMGHLLEVEGVYRFVPSRGSAVSRVPRLA